MAYFQSESGQIFESDYPEYHKNETRMTAKAGKAAYRAQACADLREFITPGTKVYCVLKSRARSGMSREIQLLVATNVNGATDLRDITCLAGIATDTRVGKNGGLVMGGCGVDMGFAAVYSLGHALWPNGTETPHGTRNGTPDQDGGYALKHVWL